MEYEINLRKYSSNMDSNIKTHITNKQSNNNSGNSKKNNINSNSSNNKQANTMKKSNSNAKYKLPSLPSIEMLNQNNKNQSGKVTMKSTNNNMSSNNNSNSNIKVKFNTGNISSNYNNNYINTYDNFNNANSSNYFNQNNLTTSIITNPDYFQEPNPNIPSIEEVYDMELYQLEEYENKLALDDSEEAQEVLNFIKYEIKERKVILDVYSFFTELSAEDFLCQIEEDIIFNKNNMKKSFNFNLDSERSNDNNKDHSKDTDNIDNLISYNNVFYKEINAGTNNTNINTLTNNNAYNAKNANFFDNNLNQYQKSLENESFNLSTCKSVNKVNTENNTNNSNNAKYYNNFNYNKNISDNNFNLDIQSVHTLNTNNTNSKGFKIIRPNTVAENNNSNNISNNNDDDTSLPLIELKNLIKNNRDIPSKLLAKTKIPKTINISDNNKITNSNTSANSSNNIRNFNSSNTITYAPNIHNDSARKAYSNSKISNTSSSLVNVDGKYNTDKIVSLGNDKSDKKNKTNLSYYDQMLLLKKEKEKESSNKNSNNYTSNRNTDKLKNCKKPLTADGDARSKRSKKVVIKTTENGNDNNNDFFFNNTLPEFSKKTNSDVKAINVNVTDSNNISNNNHSSTLSLKRKARKIKLLKQQSEEERYRETSLDIRRKYIVPIPSTRTKEMSLKSFEQTERTNKTIKSEKNKSANKDKIIIVEDEFEVINNPADIHIPNKASIPNITPLMKLVENGKINSSISIDCSEINFNVNTVSKNSLTTSFNNKFVIYKNTSFSLNMHNAVNSNQKLSNMKNINKEININKLIIQSEFEEFSGNNNDIAKASKLFKELNLDPFTFRKNTDLLNTNTLNNNNNDRNDNNVELISPKTIQNTILNITNTELKQYSNNRLFPFEKLNINFTGTQVETNKNNKKRNNSNNSINSNNSQISQITNDSMIKIDRKNRKGANKSFNYNLEEKTNNDNDLYEKRTDEIYSKIINRLYYSNNYHDDIKNVIRSKINNVGKNNKADLKKQRKLDHINSLLEVKKNTDNTNTATTNTNSYNYKNESGKYDEIDKILSTEIYNEGTLKDEFKNINIMDSVRSANISESNDEANKDSHKLATTISKTSMLNNKVNNIPEISNNTNMFLKKANPNHTAYTHKPTNIKINNKMNSTTGSFNIFNNPNKNPHNRTFNNFKLNKTPGTLIPNLPDYSKIFPSFQHIFNGFYLQNDYKQFNYVDCLQELLKSFEQLVKYENAQITSEVDELSTNIVNAEAEIIKNRLKKLSDKLLFDQTELSDEKFYMFKKIIELQKKDYYKKTINNSNNNSELSKYFFRVVLSKPEVYDIVSYTLGVKPEWRELPHGMLLGNTWTILWTYSFPKIDLSKIFVFQKVNHLVNNRIIGRKDLLKKAIQRVKKLNSKCNTEFDIIPETFILGKEYMEFIEAYSNNGGKKNKNNIWIVKPCGKSRGRGIFLTNELSDVQPIDGNLVQKYIVNPYLLNKQYKFDLRIYVLVTSVNPLEAFIYKDGFARVSNYEYDINNLNRLIHLTNAAVQNKETKKAKIIDLEKQYGGSKINLDILRVKLEKDGIDFDVIWNQIKMIVMKSLICCQYEMNYSPSTYELFGYDIMIDQNLKCWLIEVNMSPSLERSNVLDDQIKLSLVDDVLKVLEIPNINRVGLVEVLNRRLQIAIRNNIAQSQSNFIYSPITQLNIDLNTIFEGKMIREYGQMPSDCGRFERICPSAESDVLIKLANKCEKDKFDIKSRYYKGNNLNTKSEFNSNNNNNNTNFNFTGNSKKNDISSNVNSKRSTDINWSKFNQE